VASTAAAAAAHCNHCYYSCTLLSLLLQLTQLLLLQWLLHRTNAAAAATAASNCNHCFCNCCCCQCNRCCCCTAPKLLLLLHRAKTAAAATSSKLLRLQPYRLYGVGSGQKVTRAVPLCTSLSVAACTACTACAQKAFLRIICPPYFTNTLRSGDRSHAALGFLLSLQLPSQTPSLLVLGLLLLGRLAIL
jgi:hypothetical protein